MSYTVQETETVINLCYGENLWDIYTSIPRHVTKFRKLAVKWGAEVKEIHVGGIRVKLPLKAVTFKAPSNRKMTEEQKEAARLRFQRMWEKRRAAGEVTGDIPDVPDEDLEDEDETDE